MGQNRLLTRAAQNRRRLTFKGDDVSLDSLRRLVVVSVEENLAHGQISPFV
jgi:hypothetical protein